MKTVTIQIGNTDDKLKQAAWASYVRTMRSAILNRASEVHFFGASANWEQWQNAAWIVAVEDHKLEDLKESVRECRRTFGQESAAWTDGDTLFV